MLDRSSRHRRAKLYVDHGLLRPDRKTVFSGPYPRIWYRQRRDNIRFRTRSRDTLDHLATVFYQDPRLWWLIADYQPEDSVPILSPLETLKSGTLLIIPSTTVVRMFFSLE